ncbi:MAG TPA: RagB/SusD family nutrient uptake outer membrane protein [Gemmatimonadales bacterium]|nr:RagB/SusD family nutrient uptake outer membrane protein [Gemmatimonadales bacterium]
MRKAIAALTLMSALAVGACNFDLTNPNSPPPIGPNATPDQVKSAAVGLLVALRVDVTRWVLNNGILGREGYRLDTADPRFTTELLAGPLDPSNDAFGGGQWAAEFRAIQSGYAILNVIGSAQIPTGQQEAARGFVHTMQAVAFLMVLNSHTQDSIPVDVNRSVSQPLAPFVSNDSAYKYVLSLLDSAKTELQAATAFSFDPGPGFVGFNTPATFLKVNRALAARVQAYRASPSAPGVGCTACWDSVLTNLAASFIDPAAPLDIGAYHAYSTGNQDVTNGLSQDPASAIQLAHPMVKDSAEVQNLSTLPDRRFLAKVTDRKSATATVPDTFSLACLKSALAWIRYPTPNSAIPMIRNEELFLLRAEANWFGATGSKAQAVSDLNFIRQTSGNLAPTTVTIASTDAAFVNALLHERLYSLLYEGHRWVDMRRYGRLNQVIIDRPTGCASAGIPPDVVFSTLPINLFEVQARQ